MLLPIFIYYFAGRRIKLWLKYSLFSALVVVGFYYPFWQGFDTIRFGVLNQIPSFASFPALIFLLFGKSIGQQQFFWAYSIIFLAFFTFIYAYLFFRSVDFVSVLRSSFFLILFFVFFINYGSQPWYFLWVLPLGFLLASSFTVSAAVFFSLVALLAYPFSNLGFSFLLVFSIFYAIVALLYIYSDEKKYWQIFINIFN